MNIAVFLLSCSTLVGIIGWTICYRNNKKTSEGFAAERDNQEKLIATLFREHSSISRQFMEANTLQLDDQGKKLQNAFLTNTSTAGEISEELKWAQNLVANAFSSLPNLKLCSSRTSEATQLSREKIDELTQSMDAWQASFSTLDSIQGLIDDIQERADQIQGIDSEANLLALNASIEAARAGKHGRGFAVVAQSVRDLSKKSAVATTEINQSVELARGEVSKIVQGIEHSVDLLTQVTNDVTQRFVDIEFEVANINSIASLSNEESVKAKDEFAKINQQVNGQLESITKLLADTMGEITGIKIQDIKPDNDIGGMEIIDVRGPDEFNDDLGHIPNARSVPIEDHFEDALRGLDKKQPYLFVCRGGGRSARGARMALGLGFDKVYNLEGGMLAWCNKHGKPVGSQNPNEALPECSVDDDVTLF